MAENQAQSTRKWLATAKTVRHAVTTVAATAKPLPALPHLGPVFPILRPVLMPSCACPVKGPRVPVPPRSVPALGGGGWANPAAVHDRLPSDPVTSSRDGPFSAG